MENNSTNVEQQRSISYTTVQGTKRPKQLNNFGKISALYFPKRNIIKPAENAKTITWMFTNMPKNLYVTITNIQHLRTWDLNFLMMI